MCQRLFGVVLADIRYSFQILILLIGLIQPSFLQGQSLKVQFNRVSIEDTTVFRDVSARFPYPVLSLITVRDHKNRYVHGLADTSRWLYPTDTTESGHLVDNIWRTVLEYHDENHSIPSNPDVKQTDSSYMVTEIFDVNETGVSVVLVMDYSSSMGDTIYKAEDAAKMLIREMNSADRVALIKFDQDVVVYQNFTSDTTTLIQAIDEEYPDRYGTSLWDAIDAAVMLAKSEANDRKHVVVYTDGKDEGSELNYLEVISHAQLNHVSVYTIGLGDKIDPYRLSIMADSTGGEYKHAPKLKDLPGIYLEIMKEIKAHYALAHMSTDPFTNGTRRVVDVTLVSPKGLSGRGLGYYDVPNLIPNVTVSKEVKSDLFSIEMGDTLYHALAGDTVSYSLDIINNGRGTAGNVQVVDFLADSLYALDFEVTPDLITEDSIRWVIPRIDPGRSFCINYRARVSSKMPSEGAILTNTVRIDCVSDSISTDNEDQADLYAYGISDLVIQLIPPAVNISPRYPFTIDAVVKNAGTADVTTPFQIGYYVQELGSQPVDVDTVSGLAVNDSIRVQGLCSALESGEYTLKVFVDYEQVIDESNELNNWDSCHVVVGVDSITVRVSDISYSDQVRGVQGEFPGPVFTRVNVVDQNGKHVLGLADTTKWLSITDVNHLGDVVGDVWQQLLEYHKEDTLYPANPDVRPGLNVTEIKDSNFSLVFVGDFSSQVAGWDDNLRAGLSLFVDQFTGNDWGAVIGVGDGVEMMQSFTQDGALIKDAFNRSFTDSQRPLYDGLHEAITLASSRAGRQGVLAMIGGGDTGSSHASSEVVDAALEYGIPIYMIGLGAGSHANSLRMICEETGGWYVELSEGTETQKGFDAVEHYLRYYFVLSHTSPDTIQAHNWRTVNLLVSYTGLTGADKGYYLSPSGAADLAITKSAATQSFSASEGDTSWFVQPGDSIRYTVQVRNVGHKDVEDVTIEDVLPSDLVPVQFERTPDSIQENTISWVVDSIPLFESIQFSYRCFVDTLLRSETFALVNKVSIECVQDTLYHNNFDSTIVYNIPLKGADAIPQKVGIGDSVVVSQGDSVWYTFPGSTIEYHVSVINEGELNCRDITVQDILPEDVELIDFSELSYSISGDTLSWVINQLDARGGQKDFVYTCRVDTFMPPWVEPLINEVTVYSDDDTTLWNNTTRDTVWVQGPVPPDPQVRVDPLIVVPGDSVQIEVMTPVDIQSWDLRIRFEDNSEITDYADIFIQGNPNLEPNHWVVVIPEFGDTWMRTNGEEEMVVVIFETRDLWDVVRTGSAQFMLRSADEFLLDENVFRPGREGPLGMRFRLSSNRMAEIVVYDVSGGFVKKVYDAPGKAGWNTTSWDGKDQYDLRVGSGVYIAILHSGEFKKARKFILVR